ncbi:MAG: hypothetical protein P8182_10565 [Deltaproteobacteria bacterium]
MKSIIGKMMDCSFVRAAARERGTPVPEQDGKENQKMAGMVS